MSLGEHWHSATLLRFLALGALLADRELRKNVPPEDFYDTALRKAVEELRGGRQQEYSWLREILERCGVYWDDKGKEKPLDAVFNRLRLDGECARALRYLNNACEILNAPEEKHGCPASDEEKQGFLEAVRMLGKELK